MASRRAADGSPRRRGRPRGTQILGTGGGGMEDQARVGAGDLGVSVVIPVEQRADLVVGVGDKTVERHGSLRDHLSHPGTFLSSACSSGLWVFSRGAPAARRWP